MWFITLRWLVVRHILSVPLMKVANTRHSLKCRSGKAEKGRGQIMRMIGPSRLPQGGSQHREAKDIRKIMGKSRRVLGKNPELNARSPVQLDPFTLGRTPPGRTNDGYGEAIGR